MVTEPVAGLSSFRPGIAHWQAAPASSVAAHDDRHCEACGAPSRLIQSSGCRPRQPRPFPNRRERTRGLKADTGDTRGGEGHHREGELGGIAQYNWKKTNSSHGTEYASGKWIQSKGTDEVTSAGITPTVSPAKLAPSCPAWPCPAPVPPRLRHSPPQPAPEPPRGAETNQNFPPRGRHTVAVGQVRSGAVRSPPTHDAI